MSVLWMIGSFVVILTPIILIHELGHYLAARWFDIEVEEFGIGFPPRAVTLFERGGTIFSLNWIPLGGFVRPKGEDDPNIPGGLAAASKTARFTVLIAGAFFNFILAFFIFWFAFMLGAPIYADDQVVVGNIQPGSPAEAAGFMIDDLIVSANGVAIDSFEILGEQVKAFAGTDLTVEVQRDGVMQTVVVRPRAEGEYDASKEGPLGVQIIHPDTGERESLGPVAAMGPAVESIWGVIDMTVSVPMMIYRGELEPSQARPVSIVGISQMAGQQVQNSASSGEWFNSLFFAGLISVALGFTNLLPLPALDGGRIVFVLIEMVRGRRIEPEHEGMVHVVGMVFLLGLMLILIIQDIVNPLV